MRGTSGDGQPGWGIKVSLKGSDQDGPEDHEYRVANGRFDANVEQPEKDAVLSLIQQWEEQLPLMVASPNQDLNCRLNQTSIPTQRQLRGKRALPRSSFLGGTGLMSLLEIREKESPGEVR